MKTTQAPEKNRSEELAILVHGTFAGDDANTGDKWWQSGSREALELQSRLPKNVRIAANKEVFHWSGENGERARSKAACQLLEHLRPLEKSKRSYHLVGHSHGGSVIWNALRMATLAGKPLRGLRSWTTVGTPFLHHSSRKPWHVMNLLGLVFGLALIGPAFKAAHNMATLLWKAACGGKAVFMARTDEEAGYFAVLRAPFLALGEWLGVAVERTSVGIQLGSFDPSGDTSLLYYLFATREGLILLILVFVSIYIFFHLAILSVRPVIESLRIHAESRLQRRAFDRYGPCWLGIWSPDDEAINGLRATLDLSTSFVKKLVPSDRVFLTDYLSLLSRPYYWVLAPLFNRGLRPVVNSLVRNVLIRSAQGNDRPTAQVVAVLPTPVSNAHEVPPLPEFLQKKILHEADRHAVDVVPKLRQLLGSPSFTSGLENLGAELSGKELVHTSYFDHTEVLDLMALNIDCDIGKKIHFRGAMPNDRLLIAWFQSFKTQVAGEGSQSQAGKEDVLPHPQLISPRRRKAS